MDLIKLVENLSPEMYQRFLCAVETGKWPEGTVVADEQRVSAMHIVMAYQSRVLQSDENMTIGPDGAIVQKSKRELKAQFQQPVAANSESEASDTIARFSNL